MVQVHHYHLVEFLFLFSVYNIQLFVLWIQFLDCLLYTSDAADE